VAEKILRVRPAPTKSSDRMPSYVRGLRDWVTRRTRNAV
jgi:hypothetical protein